MNFNFADRMSRLGTESAFEVLAKAKKLEAQGKPIIHLEIGQPDFNTPPNICEAAFKAIRDGHTGYGHSAGLIEFREVIADHVSQTRGVSVHPDQVSVTPGAKPIMFFTILACVDPGDEVIYPDPGFPIYESVINFVGGKPIALPLIEDFDFRFRIEDLNRLVSDRTKLLIINSPQNPTGGVLTESDLNAIAELALKHDFYVLTDEVYSQLIYDGEHHSILSIDGMADRTVLLEGHSKSYAMTGWRLGYGVSPQPLADHITKLMVNSNSCTPPFTQIAGIEAIKNGKSFTEKMRTEFQKRRDLLIDRFDQMDRVSCRKPAGAFYAFPNVKNVPMSCEDLSDYLMNEANVAVLPGTAFGDHGDGYLRLSYANSIENITEALDRISTAIQKI